MALDPAERDRVRYHLGYLSVASAASMQFGLPKLSQTIFVVDLAMTQILPVAEDRVRRLLKILDDTETNILESQEHLAAAKLGNLELRIEEPELLEDEYYRWACRLADVLGVPLYPYSERFKGRGMGARGAGNIPVRR